MVGINRHSNRHSSEEEQVAFKVLMTHWILQFALRIAFRCVLHRCGSQDIHCWKCWIVILFYENSESNVLVCLFFYSKGIKRFCFITKNERNVVCVLCPRDMFLVFWQNKEQWNSILDKSRYKNSFERCGNDPSAGSPTETLLRLHLPLDIEV